MMPVAGTLAFVALLAFIAFQWHRSQGWLPAELRKGRLVGAETNLNAQSPFLITGRLDRIYQLEDGTYTPLEYKNRRVVRLHESDRAQLSLQAYLMRKNGRSTAPYGFMVVRERKTGRKKAIKVDLGDDTYCTNLIQRYIELKSGRAKPLKVSDARCKTCGHRDRC